MENDQPHSEDSNPPAEEHDPPVSEDEEDEGACLICCFDLSQQKFKAVVPCACTHESLCALCAMRLRIFSKQICPFCKTDWKDLIFTKSVGKSYGDYNLGAMVRDGEINVHFENMEDRAYFRRLRSLVCSICESHQRDHRPFQSLRQLSDHIEHCHREFICFTCADHQQIFPQELELFRSRKELSDHINKGSLHSATRGSSDPHPKCQFDNLRFYGNDQLYVHLEKEHYSCHFCRRYGRLVYEKDVYGLEKHFRVKHYLCEYPQCLRKKYVVFDNEVSLQVHKLNEHAREMDPNERKQLRTISHLGRGDSTQRDFRNRQHANYGHASYEPVSYEPETITQQPEEKVPDFPPLNPNAPGNAGRGWRPQRVPRHLQFPPLSRDEQAQRDEQRRRHEEWRRSGLAQPQPRRVQPPKRGAILPFPPPCPEDQRDSRNKDMIRRIKQILVSEPQFAKFKQYSLHFRTHQMSARDYYRHFLNLFGGQKDKAGSILVQLISLLPDREKALLLYNEYAGIKAPRNHTGSAQPAEEKRSQPNKQKPQQPNKQKTQRSQPNKQKPRNTLQKSSQSSKQEEKSPNVISRKQRANSKTKKSKSTKNKSNLEAVKNTNSDPRPKRRQGAPPPGFTQRQWQPTRLVPKRSSRAKQQKSKAERRYTDFEDTTAVEDHEGTAIMSGYQAGEKASREDVRTKLQKLREKSQAEIEEKDAAAQDVVDGVKEKLAKEREKKKRKEAEREQRAKEKAAKRETIDHAKNAPEPVNKASVVSSNGYFNEDSMNSRNSFQSQYPPAQRQQPLIQPQRPPAQSQRPPLSQRPPPQSQRPLAQSQRPLAQSQRPASRLSRPPGFASARVSEDYPSLSDSATSTPHDSSLDRNGTSEAKESSQSSKSSKNGSHIPHNVDVGHAVSKLDEKLNKTDFVGMRCAAATRRTMDFFLRLSRRVVVELRERHSIGQQNRNGKFRLRIAAPLSAEGRRFQQNIKDTARLVKSSHLETALDNSTLVNLKGLQLNSVQTLANLPMVFQLDEQNDIDTWIDTTLDAMKSEELYLVFVYLETVLLSFFETESKYSKSRNQQSRNQQSGLSQRVISSSTADSSLTSSGDSESMNTKRQKPKRGKAKKKKKQTLLHFG